VCGVVLAVGEGVMWGGWGCGCVECGLVCECGLVWVSVGRGCAGWVVVSGWRGGWLGCAYQV